MIFWGQFGHYIISITVMISNETILLFLHWNAHHRRWVAFVWALKCGQQQVLKISLIRRLVSFTSLSINLNFAPDLWSGQVNQDPRVRGGRRAVSPVLNVWLVSGIGISWNFSSLIKCSCRTYNFFSRALVFGTFEPKTLPSLKYFSVCRKCRIELNRYWRAVMLSSFKKSIPIHRYVWHSDQREYRSVASWPILTITVPLIWFARTIYHFHPALGWRCTWPGGPQVPDVSEYRRFPQQQPHFSSNPFTTIPGIWSLLWTVKFDTIVFFDIEAVVDLDTLCVSRNICFTDSAGRKMIATRDLHVKAWIAIICVGLRSTKPPWKVETTGSERVTVAKWMRSIHVPFHDIEDRSACFSTCRGASSVLSGRVNKVVK